MQIGTGQKKADISYSSGANLLSISKGLQASSVQTDNKKIRLDSKGHIDCQSLDVNGTSIRLFSNGTIAAKSCNGIKMEHLPIVVLTKGIRLSKPKDKLKLTYYELQNVATKYQV